MSRWKSPQAAAKQAERAAKEAEKLRRENRKSKLLLIGTIVLMVLSLATYLIWAFNRINEHRGHRHHHRHGTDSHSPQQSK